MATVSGFHSNCCFLAKARPVWLVRVSFVVVAPDPLTQLSARLACPHSSEPSLH